MKIRIGMVSLFVALGISILLGGTAIAGPTYIEIAHEASMMNSYGCTLVGVESGNTHKYRCSNYGHMGGFLLAVTGPLSANGTPFSCRFYGRNWSTGAFYQNWHHSLMVGGESSPIQACSVDQMSGNTWAAVMNTRYGFKPNPPKNNSDPYAGF